LRLETLRTVADRAVPPRIGWLPVVALASITVALGLYALALNRLFYATSGPFYDSLSYSLALAQVYARVHDQGLGAALLAAFGMKSTVFLPWVEACFFALAMDLRRDLFVWLQLPWLFVLGLVAYRYFLRRAGCSPALALALCLPLIAIRGVFSSDGGLSDFRMDLLQYLLLSATFLAYLSIPRAPAAVGLGPWTLCGALAGLSCLARATTPVYLALGFGPLFAIDVLRQPRDVAAMLRRYGAAALTLVIVAGWFYAVNFRHLHYYYVVWNQAANAKLPLSLSLAHVGILFGQNIGWPIVAFLGLCIGLGAMHRLNAGLLLWRDLNWRALWLGAAPLAVLVASGAGLNPFVSMAAAGGLIAFGESVWVSDPGPRPRWMEAVLVGGALAASLASAATGVAAHSQAPSWVPRSSAIEALVQQLTTDISARPAGRYALCAVHSGSFDINVVESFLIFDRRLPHDADGAILFGKSVIRPGYNPDPTKVAWDSLPGAADAAKIGYRVSSILRDCDYVLLPTAASQLSPFAYVNAHVPEISRRLLASPGVARLGPAVAVTPYESVAWHRIARGN